MPNIEVPDPQDLQFEQDCWCRKWEIHEARYVPAVDCYMCKGRGTVLTAFGERALEFFRARIGVPIKTWPEDK